MNRYPAVVRSVDRDRREVRVEIPGITDGAEVFPLAEIEYPIGDRSEQTEIRIVEGDRVWVAFHAGDPRYPIITGFRAKHAGNGIEWRRWAHDNFEITADGIHRIIAMEKAEVIVGASKIEVTDGVIKLIAGSASIEMSDSGVTILGTRIDLNP